MLALRVTLRKSPLHPNCTQIPHRFSVNSLTSRAAAFLAHRRLHFAIHVVMTSKCTHASFDTASRRSDFQNSKHCAPTFSRVLRSDRTLSDCCPLSQKGNRPGVLGITSKSNACPVSERANSESGHRAVEDMRASKCMQRLLQSRKGN
jgi:hypothetical protein